MFAHVHLARLHPSESNINTARRSLCSNICPFWKFSIKSACFNNNIEPFINRRSLFFVANLDYKNLLFLWYIQLFIVYSLLQILLPKRT